MKPAVLATACLLALCGDAIPQEPAAGKALDDDAAAFGALPFIYSAALSANGKAMVGVGPGKGTETIAFVLNLAAAQRTITAIAQADGQPMNLTTCNWSALDRVVCSLYGITNVSSTLLPVRRTLAMDSDGRGKPLTLGQADNPRQIRLNQFDGRVIDWLDGVDGKVLMIRNKVPDFSTGTRLGSAADGLGVELVDTRNAKVKPVERPQDNALDYIADGRGAVRLMTTQVKNDDGSLLGLYTHLYRTADGREWKELGRYKENDGGMEPLAVDPGINAAYVLQPLDGRKALYRIALDGSMKSELVFASPEVDIDDVVRMGRSGRVIGVTWTTDRQQVEYFDPAYREVTAALKSALPKLPLIRFASASADEKTLLVWAGSDVDPEHLYLYERSSQKLSEVMPSRPALKRKTLSPVRSITYAAADGTKIPAYLTLPPGVTETRGLPAIVMPHGGPEARDEWGFDWMVQFFAQRGFAVLQPNFRGSGGYGDQWLIKNGFQSWKTAIGDVCDAGRWLVTQGAADPNKLAIFGWSYGGYAALQANVLAPDLFKAVVAVAPVSDLAQLKNEAEMYTSGDLVKAYIGDGPHISEGSPARNATVFKAPVLMFHGDMDLNVNITQSRRMDSQLREAGKATQLVVYPKLDHSLRDGGVRADLLRKAEAFLRRNLGM